GPLFERWAAKTAVGLFCAVGKKGDVWQLSDSPPCDPPEVIVNSIFGDGVFEAPMGLYFAQAIGDTHNFPEGLSVKPLLYPDDGLVGALLVSKGIQFLIWLSDQPILPFEAGNTVFGPGPEDESLLYHLRALRFTVGKPLSQVIEFRWS